MQRFSEKQQKPNLNPNRRTYEKLLAILFLTLLCAGITPTTASAQDNPPAHKKTAGIIIEWSDTEERLTASLGPDVMSKLKIRGVVAHMGNENKFPADRVPSGTTALFFLEPMNYNLAPGDPGQKQFAYDAILEGKWDAYFEELAKSLAAFGQEVIFVPFPEMNGNWTPTSLQLFGNTADKHKKAYRRIAEIMRKFGGNKVKMGWCVNQVSVPADLAGNQILDLYPGHDVVQGYRYLSGWYFTVFPVAKSK